MVTTEELREDVRTLTELSADIGLAFAAATPVDLQDFDFLFPTLQTDETKLLPQSADMPAKLKTLGRSMEDPGPDSADDPGDSAIPAAYTYFGQFVDHDITFEVQPADLPNSESGAMPQLLADNMTPLPLEQIRNALRNFRTATLDLDSVYGLPAQRDPLNGSKMRIGRNTSLGNQPPPLARPPQKDLDNDVPRDPPSASPLHDRAARIGDPRNDENLIVSQLHLAFLKAHNRLVDDGRSFDEARRILRQHYQHIVIHDFLRNRVCDGTIVDDILQNGNHWYNALAEPFFMPLEFAVAAYRFGHTMVRAEYNFNINFGRNRPGGPAALEALFTFTALSGQLGGSDTVPENWIIEWHNIIGDAADVGKARRFDTKLAAVGATALFNLQNLEGQPEEEPSSTEPADARRLAVRNLLRGYRLRLPTGQAVAEFLGLPALTPAELEAAAANADQVQALQDGGFLERTPLWYYLLAEAKHPQPTGGGGERLGAVGSTIVAEVLIGLVRRSEDSILRMPGWTPSLPSAQPGTFELADLLRFAGVLPVAAPPPRTYIVRPGDTLASIAQQELGDAGRWPEIFLLNRGSIRHPDLIFVGQVLTLPGDVPTDPPPRLYTVRPGDTLADIAEHELGDRNRWPELFNLNRAVISDPDVIFPGQVLLLPS
jgi:nucleoid-associated protein YgaU